MSGIFTLHIAYKGLEDKIWRDATLLENATLNDLAYLIMATFDTMAYHQYKFEIKGEHYYCFNEEYDESTKFTDCHLSDFVLQVADYFTFEYDFGIGHEFTVQVLENYYSDFVDPRMPLIIHGEGCGIIDDYSFDDIKNAIEEIDLMGKMREPIYYKERTEPWDYRDFNLKTACENLKKETEVVEKKFS